MTAVVGWELHRDALRGDEERFEAEAWRFAALVESNMERYEERLARFADHCALFGDLPREVWSFRRHHVLDPSGNLPWVKHLIYCPKERLTNSQPGLRRGTPSPGVPEVTSPPGREVAATPVSERLLTLPLRWISSQPGFEPLIPGTDLAEISDTHPFLAPALARAKGWVSTRPASVRRADGRIESGFWFALALFATNEPGPVWMLKNETVREQQLRHGAYLKSAAKGLIAAFISADHMMDGSFNRANQPAHVHARLYSAQEPVPEALMNRASNPPDNPRHRRVIPQKWYSRVWCLELVSTPLLEAESLRHRAWLVLGGGTVFTLLAGALVWVSVRARVRQERLTVDVLEARDALTVAQQERERLSHDLHDGTVQSLYAIQLGLGHTAQKLEGEPAQARRELSTVRAELDAVIAEIRRFITADENAEIKADLAGVIEALVQRAKAGATAKVELHCDPNASSRLTGNQAVQLANIAREALSNSLRHARPDRIEVRLAVEGTCVCLEIADDGGGFHPQSPTRPGVGLASMASRATEIGGRLEIQSAPGEGTRVSVRVPASPGRAAGPQ